MSFSQTFVNKRTGKNHFLKQINLLINWNLIDHEIKKHYRPISDVIGRPAYPGLLLFKMLLTGIWMGGLSDVQVEEQANSNLYVMTFLGLTLEDDVPDHSVLSRFRTKLTKANAWDLLLNVVNAQLAQQQLLVTKGMHIDGSLTRSPFKPKQKPTYEVKDERDEAGDEETAHAAMQITEVEEPQVDTDARWTKKSGKSVFGYKQNTLVNDDGLVLAVETTAANQHDSKLLKPVLEKITTYEKQRVYADKAYVSAEHKNYLRQNKLKNGLQDRAYKNKPLSARQKARNKKITQVRYVVERTFGSQARWFGGKELRYKSLGKAHAWHILLAVAYNLKRLPGLLAKHCKSEREQRGVLQDSCAC